MEARSFALLRSGLFSALPDEAFAELVKQVTEVEVRAGELVLREGDEATAFFVVQSGCLEVFTHSSGGQEVVLTELRSGRHFGEQALLAGESGRRSASVRGTAEVSVLLRLGRDHLQAALAVSPDLQHGLLALGQQQSEERLSRRSELVRALIAESAMKVEERTFRNSHVLYREGDPTGVVYVLLSGYVELFAEREGAPVRVARIGPGLAVGERDDDTRAATAIVDGTAKLLVVDREHLARRTKESAELRDHLATLQRVWELPQRGYVTQYAGTVMGRPCVTQVFHLSQRRSFVSTHVVGVDSVRLQAGHAVPDRWIAAPGDRLRIALDGDRRITGVDAREASPSLAPLFARAIEGRPLTAAEESGFIAGGSLAQDDGGYLCTCMRVTRGAVQAAVREGLADLRAIQERTGCGMACGTCVPSVIELLGEASFVPVVVTRIDTLTGEVRRLHLGAAGEPLPPARPGQHVVLRVRAKGALIERPYTLSGAAGAPWEVTVKREPNGRFSEWLFGEAGVGAKLEASTPRGTYLWDAGPAPIVCLTSGIGVTPALAFARTLLREGWPHRLVIDWSARDEADVAILGELAAAAAPNLILQRRVTSRQGRMKPADVHAWARRFPTALFYLCGSDGFMSDVEGWLTAAGVAKDRVRIERFDRTPRGVPA